MAEQAGSLQHTVKHFALHRIGGVEWRVISDIEAGVIAITEVEEAVLTRFVARPDWPHAVVTFFVLNDLSALQRQLNTLAAQAPIGLTGATVPFDASGALPPGGVEGLAQRTVVNLYDLANAATCTVFVNKTAMEKAGYWGDRLAETALLAHEHAHPLVENATVRASRNIAVTVNLDSDAPLGQTTDTPWRERLQGIVQALLDSLVRYAPRELFTNDMVIEIGFAAALFHLDRRTIELTASALQGRAALAAGLRAEPTLTDTGRAAFLALADYQAHLNLAFEVAAFQRMGEERFAEELKALLQQRVFALLPADTERVFTALTNLYKTLPADHTPATLVVFAQAVAEILASALHAYGVRLEVNTAIV